MFVSRQASPEGGMALAAKDRFVGYKAYDPNGEKVGKVDGLFGEESDRPEYVGAKMDLFGLSFY
jgi:hypothetical protein